MLEKQLNRFSLDIAGVVAEIETPDAAWAAALAERYATFLSDAAAAWRLVITHTPDLTKSAAPWIRHEGSLTRFRLYQHAGIIDLGKRCATVCTANPQLAASALERGLSYILMQTLPRDHDGLLIHGAGVVLSSPPSALDSASGYLFAGHSGAGKSTVAGLAQGVGQVLSDENMVVRLTADGGVELCSTPFWGHSTPPERVHRINRRVPLAGIYMLTHAADFELTRLRSAEAVAALLSTEKVATERVESAAAWLAIAGRLAATIPIYRLAFRPTQELWTFLAKQS